MNVPEMTAGSLDHLNGRDFQRLAKFIHDYSGIKMPETKKTRVEGRLRTRVGATGFANLKRLLPLPWANSTIPRLGGTGKPSNPSPP